MLLRGILRTLRKFGKLCNLYVGELGEGEARRKWIICEINTYMVFFKKKNNDYFAVCGICYMHAKPLSKCLNMQLIYKLLNTPNHTCTNIIKSTNIEGGAQNLYLFYCY